MPPRPKPTIPKPIRVETRMVDGKKIEVKVYPPGVQFKGPVTRIDRDHQNPRIKKKG